LDLGDGKGQGTKQDGKGGKGTGGNGWDGRGGGREGREEGSEEGKEEVKKVKFFHTRYRALGPELIPVYRQSARR